MDSVNSTTFIKRPPFMTETQECILYIKEMLVDQLFLGSYQERRLVPVLNEYRDVVVISSEERDLHCDIDKVRRKWLPVSEIKWVGITGPDTENTPKAYCFWVKLSNLPFGYHWFQIKNVKFIKNEILLNLKCVRKSQPSDLAFFSHRSQLSVAPHKNETQVSSTPQNPSIDKFNWDVVKETQSKIYQTCTDVVETTWLMLTWRNFFTVLKSGVAIIVALLLASISGVQYLGEYALKLIQAVTNLINAFSPIIVQLIDFFTKVVGGLFILIAGMFRTNVPGGYLQPQRVNYIRYTPHSESSDSSEQNVNWRIRNRNLRRELFSDQRF